MKRRDFLHTVVNVPAGAVLLEQPAAAGHLVPPDAERVEAFRIQASSPVESPLVTVGPDAVATLVPGFLAQTQLATLRRLADLLLPPLNGNPGAKDVQAAEYLDNYLARSGADRQQLYRNGLDDLERRAQGRFSRAFAELTAADADAIVKPLFNVRGPTMSVVELGPFINRVLQDIRTVTINSPQWAAAQAASDTPVLRVLYWSRVDPTVPHEGVAPWQSKTETTRF